MKPQRLITLICAFAICLAPLPVQPSAQSQANINAPNALNGRRNQGRNNQSQSNKPETQNNNRSNSGSNSPSKPDKPDKNDKPDKPNKPSTSQGNNVTGTRHQTVAGHKQGWRIQAYQTSNSRTGKQAATERGRAIAMKYPSYRTYITYKAPSWKLRIGDFEDEDAAKKALRNLRASFPQFASEMTIVRDKVNLWR